MVCVVGRSVVNTSFDAVVILVVECVKTSSVSVVPLVGVTTVESIGMGTMLDVYLWLVHFQRYLLTLTGLFSCR